MDGIALEDNCHLLPRTPLLQAGAAIFAEGGFKGGNDARYRGARRSVDQIALPAGLLKVVSPRAR
jgi:hypothetical protein